MTLAEFLRIEMRRKHLNQSELARVLGVYPNYVQRWINGYKPRPEQCARIAEALGISANQVMQMAGYPVDTISPGIDPKKAAALMEFGRLLDERPNISPDRLMAITRVMAEAIDSDVEREPAEHHGNDEDDKVDIIHSESVLIAQNNKEMSVGHRLDQRALVLQPAG